LFALAMILFVLPAAASTEVAKIPAHPALWTVHSKVATAYLLGSIHLLPSNMKWRTPAIDQAMKSADTYFFETSLDPVSIAEMGQFVLDHGSLPKGQSLRGMLDERTLVDYDRALAELHLPRDRFDTQRPWLASLSLNAAYLTQMN